MKWYVLDLDRACRLGVCGMVQAGEGVWEEFHWELGQRQGIQVFGENF